MRQRTKGTKPFCFVAFSQDSLWIAACVNSPAEFHKLRTSAKRNEFRRVNHVRMLCSAQRTMKWTASFNKKLNSFLKSAVQVRAAVDLNEAELSRSTGAQFFVLPSHPLLKQFHEFAISRNFVLLALFRQPVELAWTESCR